MQRLGGALNLLREKLILKLKQKIDFVKKNLVQFRMIEFSLGSNSQID